MRNIFLLNLGVSTLGFLLILTAVGSHTAVDASFLSSYWGFVPVGIASALVYRYLETPRVPHKPNEVPERAGVARAVLVITIISNLVLCPALIFNPVPRLLCLVACIFLAALPLAQARVNT